MNEQSTSPMLLAILEDTLVSEFRAYEALLSVTRDERRILSVGDAKALLELIRHKSQLLDDVDQLERKRQETISAWSQLVGRQSVPANLRSMLPDLDATMAQRLDSLRDGILVLIEEQRELARGNKLLVNSALQQVQAVRDFLLNLCDTPRGYQPVGVSGPARSRVSLAMEHVA